MTELNFDGLMNLGESNKAPASTPKTNQAETNSHELNKMKKVNNATLEAYKRMQETKKRTTASKTNLIRGIQQEKDLYSLMMDAVDVIGIATQDSAFTAQTKNDLKRLYGKKDN